MFIRTLLFFTGALVAQQSFAGPAVLLQFSNGNQIFGSELVIYSDGSLVHNERSCCPPHVDATPESNLSPTQLQHLEALILAASSGRIVERAGSLTSEGSQSGSLLVYDNGKATVVLEVDRSAAGTPNKDLVNLSSSASEIKTLVETYVKYPLVP